MLKNGHLPIFCPRQGANRGKITTLVAVMSKRVVIAPDSFKGSLSAVEVGEALGEGIRSVLPDCRVEVVPIADGGEGSAEIITHAMGGKMVSAEAHDPLGRTITAHYGILPNKVAVIDVASAAGLTLLSEGEKDPLRASSCGVGEVIADALSNGCTGLILGLGGSATNDCGVGILSALGYRFLDSHGEEVFPSGGNLYLIEHIDPTHALPQLRHTPITLAVDVRAPFCGEGGAARVFAPQKGATPSVVERLDEGMAHFAGVVERHCGVDICNLAGAGAAGGIGGTLHALLGATIRSGAEVVLESVSFEERIAGCNLVVTGEGCIDHQTLLGKAPSEVLGRAAGCGVRCVAVGGSVRLCPELEQSAFADIVTATPKGMPLEQALQPEVAKRNLHLAGRKIAKKWLG